MKTQLKKNRLLWIAAFFVLVIGACKKSAVDKQADIYKTEKDWIHQNAGVYKGESMNYKTSDGEIKKGSLDWSHASRFSVGGINYTEIPFSLTPAPDVSLSMVLRTVNDQTEAAIKVTQLNAKLAGSQGTKLGTIETYNSLAGTTLVTWFREAATGRLMKAKGEAQKVSVNGASSVTKPKINLAALECDIYTYDVYGYYCWGNPVGNDYNVSCGYIYEGSFTIAYCWDSGGGGGGGGGGTWPPPTGGGGGSNPPNPTPPPCPTSGAAIKQAFPSASLSTANTLADYVNKYSEKFGINTAEKMRHFLAQAATETGGFGTLNKTESLNYSSPSRLEEVYPKKFSQTNPNLRDPNNYLHNPQAVANAVYSNRYGNGSEASGDGYNYRGRGLLQLTFKDNYLAFQNYYNGQFPSTPIDAVSNPGSIASDAELSVLSAMWFFKDRVLDKINVDANTSVESVTRKVNGGTNALQQRQTYFNSAQSNINCL